LMSPYKASIEAISKYIVGDVDDDKIEELLWGMILIDHWKLSKKPSFSFVRGNHGEVKDHVLTPRPYALLKLVFLPQGFKTNDATLFVRPEPAIPALLRAGRIGEACTIAARRLRVSGMIPLTSQKHGRPFFTTDWQAEGIDPIRLGAALLFPISFDEVDELKLMVLRPEKNQNAA